MKLLHFCLHNVSLLLRYWVMMNLLPLSISSIDNETKEEKQNISSSLRLAQVSLTSYEGVTMGNTVLLGLWFQVQL